MGGATARTAILYALGVLSLIVVGGLVAWTLWYEWLHPWRRRPRLDRVSEETRQRLIRASREAR